MVDQNAVDYTRIESAIKYIRAHLHDRPSLGQIAEEINLSEFHFQRMFTQWAGISPKKFTHYLNLEHAKAVLGNQDISLSDAAYEAGLSGTSRLHDLFVNVEGMTPGEYKNGGVSLNINYHFANSPFGKIIIASTNKGICHLHFIEDEQQAFEKLQSHFPNANYVYESDNLQESALGIFHKDWSRINDIKLHLAGSPFQLKVWEGLLKIPQGSLTTYGKVAHLIDNIKASRAVGTAIGANPVAFIIPCHRVIKRNGHFGQYMWGETRKASIIGWEAASGGL